MRDFLIDFDRKKLQMENLAGNEATGQIIKSTPARHLYTAKLKTFNAVSGNLYLTPQRLFFLPHPLAFVTYEVTISIDSIRQVEPFSTKLLASPGIVVHLRDGKVEKFLLKERDLWVNQLSELMQ